MSTLFYRNVQLLLLTICLIVVWGISAFLTMPRLEDPVLTQRNALIKTAFAGATVERVETLVTDKIEEELSDIEEIKNLESTSRPGFSIISIELKDTVKGKDADEVWSRVRNRITDAIPQLPSESSRPRFEKLEIKANALIVALTWKLKQSTDYTILRRLSEELKDQLRYIPGTTKVEMFGDPNEEIIVEIRPSDLASLGLTVPELSRQILSSDAKVAAGQLRSSNNDLLFEVEDELDSLERINRIPIRFGNSGQFTRLGDIAQIKQATVEPLASLALVSGQPAITLEVLVEPEKRLDDWKHAADQTIEKFRAQLPSGIGLKVLLDQSNYVAARIRVVLQELLIGSVLAMIVLYFMMGWRSALVVAVTLPLSSLIVFGAMQVLKVPLHQMSITGLIIALGLLVDNSIAVVDEVQVRLHEGMAPEQAIADSIKHLGVPLLSSTISTVLAFLPIALAPGGVGEFTGTIGLSSILGLIASLITSLTILPAVAGKLHDWTHRGHTSRDVWWETGFSHPQLTRVYRWTLDKALARPVIAISMSLILPIAGFAVAPHLDMEFFPPSGRDQFYIELELPIQASLEKTESSVLQARQLIQKHPEVTDVHWFIGKSAPKIYYNIINNRDNSSNYAQGLVQLQPNVSPLPVIQTLQKELDQAFPSAIVWARQLEQGPPFEAPIELRLYGPDLQYLRELGNQMRLVLDQVPDVLHTRATLAEALPKLSLKIDEEEARLAGLDKSAIAQQLDNSLEGAVGGSVLEDTENLPVRVRLSNSKRGNLDQISSLDLLSNNTPTSGQERARIPLSAMGDVQLMPDVATIFRRNRQRVNKLQGLLSAGVLPAKVLADFQHRLAASNFQLPPGYSLDFGGEAEIRSTAVTNLLSTVSVLLVLMVGTLVLTFNSFAIAGVLGLIAILAAGFGLGSLSVFGYPFGFTSILATITLIGIGINEATVVLAALLEDSLAQQGDRQGVREVVVHATRHMISTTITDMCGFFPLLFDSTGFWPPFAIVMIGGLVGITQLSLYCVPPAFLVLARRRSKISSFGSKLSELDAQA
ncbi:MAG: efflux RND transporter permease subunit [Pelatocladus maniniholoensis HA4357-MV3]|uniref:Efflux RND transporter permease subunit n=1 Tax=Pelatocladus maniniholoensis HA4357-MV3 TaxID=1117104 RepID=A0A9E3H757_9NOST|nr:efflux RND transporter permease subunit [Pelatocladus maniniholoensis HA4357-MV3]BAZ70606.1 putative RND efflux transporter [Fischerella sp. NIES-4106]